MGDLKVGESFEDRVYIVDSSGAAKTGLAPTCTIIDESGNRTAGTVAEMASGWYKVTDFTPDAAGTWCLEWAVAGAYVVQYPNKLFKVEGGLLSDIHTLLGSPVGVSVSADLAAINTALTFQQQPNASINQATPTQNQYYTVLDTTANCRIISIALRVADTNETLELKLTIDGNSIVKYNISAAAGTNYYATISQGAAYTESYLQAGTTDFSQYRAFLIEGRSVKVEIKKTTANGTGNLQCSIIYAKR